MKNQSGKRISVKEKRPSTEISDQTKPPNKIRKSSTFKPFINIEDIVDLKDINLNFDSFEKKGGSIERISTQKRWARVAGVIKMVLKMKKVSALPVDTLSQIDDCVRKWQNEIELKEKDDESEKEYDEEYTDIFKQMLLFYYLNNGDSKDLDKSREIIEKDKLIKEKLGLSDFLYDKMNPNTQMTPLYVCSSNGNKEYAEMLINMGANLKATCVVTT